ncbi:MULTISPECIES: MoaD/ThiS family protein [unclassified Polaribacter]|uniref:MoaD/ThiS family protein n=1 Tax=unclassified Polaribacter TaxID=196858 RepID=UPI0011BEACC5|nr:MULTISPECIES: MoaD/ThiS family protein [unclassified Polaribacter]TXD53209.1 MoaD/ThiS family protein [Polaribacter sp. IC063]TXD61356.1 MoaD/ThiS family protein [Polaribacter sp. IC066]
MKISVLFFGITTDLVKSSQLQIELAENSSVANLKAVLKEMFPQLVNINSYAIAVNEVYANDENLLKLEDVVAVIPPVSGG